MPNLLITPILYHYNFLDDLCEEAASLLSMNFADEKKHQEFKISIFLNFNRYLSDSLLFLPETEAEDILEHLTPLMKEEDEAETIKMLDDRLDLSKGIRSDFLNIIKNIKK